MHPMVEGKAIFMPERRKKFFRVRLFGKFFKSLANLSIKSNLQLPGRKGLKCLLKYGIILLKMELMIKDSMELNSRPACFGDEAKFVIYMETSAADSECAKCPSLEECGEFILLQCSRELFF